MTERQFQLIRGNSKEVLKRFPDRIFQCCVTSPPYWQLKNYFVDEQLGQEATISEYVNNLVDICKNIKRVLRDDGVFWLNIGDGYVKNHPENKNISFDLKRKNLIGAPWRVAFALQADGWYLRGDIIYSKTNPIPDGAKDRPTRSHEYIFQLTKKPNYFYDYFAVLEDSISDRVVGKSGFGAKKQKGTYRQDQDREFVDYGVKNKRSVWSLPVARHKGLHFATYSTQLIEPCIKSSISEKGCCIKCGSPWKRQLKKIKQPSDNKDGYISKIDHVGWEPTCKCGIKETIPCWVLDPFNGTGTTGVVALMHYANYVGIDLNNDYLKISRKKILKQDIFSKEVFKF